MGEIDGFSQETGLTREEIEKYLDYLDEAMDEYERFVNNIGNNGLAAKLLLDYRDEIQDLLEILQGKVDLKEYWEDLIKLDQIVRARRITLVREIGNKNFVMEQIRRSPPKTRWWWYLNKYEPQKPQQSFWESFGFKRKE